MSLCLWAVLQENIEKSMDCKLRRNPDTGANGCESRIDPMWGISGNDHQQSVCETQSCKVGIGGGRIPRICWPPIDDEPLRYEFEASPSLNFLWISHITKGRHNGESLFWQRIPTATSIINAILPIISAEPALFGVYADDLFSRLARISKHAEKTTTSSDRGA